MELQQLRYVVALAQERHFRRAAERVNVTQPALSLQVKKLEEELGVALFERNTRGVRLTSAGEAFIGQAQGILEATAAAKESVAVGPVQGTVPIGAIPTIGPYWLPQLIRRVQRALPRVRLVLYEETTSLLLQHLKDGRIDLAVLALPVNEPALMQRSLGDEAFYAAVPVKHRLARKAVVDWEDLKTERLLILKEGHCFGDQTAAFCRVQRDDAQIVFQGSSLTSVLELAAAGEGITFVPEMARRTRAGLRYIPLKGGEAKRTLGVLWRKAAPLGKAHRAVLTLLGVQE